ncbi:MAG: type II toxin-antitoxin system VapC family toxin [Betaproteobacteria bacterium]|nr:type II toxin-antitoxin system VapC family toxin [Betaproteobacteria bacterium]MDH4324307.1 type II toxin-antitoxin system VapC family toxin [Betaproteobacteria bacterium]MDH5212467.1 type II toxin-antitoxin system VapC family toxin [Betaproteobacteria bacterium]
MIYVDTSALVPAFIREPKSEAVLAWLETSGQRLVVSEWSITEFASAAAIKARKGEIGPALAKQARTRFLDFAETHCSIAVPQRAEFRRAAELAGDVSLRLRAGDALHLAIAEASKAEGILCLDESMAASAKTMGLNVLSV